MTAPEPPFSRRAELSVLAATCVLHLGLLVYFLPRHFLGAGTNIAEIDYSLHAYQVDRALTAFREGGRLWAYDPFCLAGQPVNTLEDLTSKSLELFVIAAASLGMSKWKAFNLYILAAHLAVPLLGWKSARLFGLSRMAAALSALSWVLLWYFDSFLHWCWYVGMISWGLASVLVVLSTALAHRALEDRTLRAYAAFIGTTALVCLVHPFAALTLVFPLGAMYLGKARELPFREHAGLGAGVLLWASTALVWVRPALAFRAGYLKSDDFLWPTAGYLLSDSLDLMRDLLMTGEPIRAGLRNVAFLLGAFTIVAWVRTRDRRAVSLGVLAGSALVLAYATAYVPSVRQTQPYRHIAPAILAAALCAAETVARSLAGEKRRALARVRPALAVLSVAALPQLSRTALYYMPTLVPAQTRVAAFVRPGPADDGTNLEPDPELMGYRLAPPEYAAVSGYLSEHFTGKGRVAVPLDWVLAEYLATFSGVPILGGIPQRNVRARDAHPMRHDMTPRNEKDDPFAGFLEQYAVTAVVTNGAPSAIDARQDVMTLSATFGAYRVYSVNRPASYFAVGEGRVVAQKLNSISVADVTGPEVVLRFHWLSTLKCRPDCRAERAPADRDGAGFIRVVNPASAFEIYDAGL